MRNVMYNVNIGNIRFYREDIKMNRRFKRTAALAVSILTVLSGASGIAPINRTALTASAAGNIPAFPGAGNRCSY